MHLSIITFLSGATPPGKGKAKQFISTFQTLEPQSPVWKQKSQWKRDAYKKYKVFLSNQESGDYIHFLYKILLKKKKGGQDPVCYAADSDSGEVYCVFWESVFRLPVFSSSQSPKVPFAWNKFWVLHKHTSPLHLLKSAALRACRTQSTISDRSSSFTLYMFSDGAVCGARVQENTAFTLGGVSNSYRVK